MTRTTCQSTQSMGEIQRPTLQEIAGGRSAQGLQRKPIEIIRAEYLQVVDTYQRSLLVRRPDVELPGRGLAEQKEEGEQRAVKWKSVVTKEFENDAHRTMPQDKAITIRVDITLKSRTKRISGKVPR